MQEPAGALRGWIGATVLAVALAAAGCGGGKHEKATTSKGARTSTHTTTSATRTQHPKHKRSTHAKKKAKKAVSQHGARPKTAPPTNSQANEQRAVEHAVRVTIRDFSYSPAHITVRVGGAVYWTNGGHTEHTATRVSGPGPSPNSPTIGRDGGTYVDFFNHPGTITYYCTYHPTRMRATITVVK